MTREVKPPWIEYPGKKTEWSGWQKGRPLAWLEYEWFSYWINLTKDEKTTYVDKWDPPLDWQEYLAKECLNEVKPPWIKYPGEEPW